MLLAAVSESRTNGTMDIVVTINRKQIINCPQHMIIYWSFDYFLHLCGVCYIINFRFFVARIPFMHNGCCYEIQ